MTRLPKSATTAIHSLAPRISEEGALRLSIALLEEMAQGAELGFRGPQIRSLGLSLEKTVAELRAILSELEFGDAADSVNTAVDHLEVLARLARSYGSVDPKQVDEIFADRSRIGSLVGIGEYLQR